MILIFLEKRIFVKSWNLTWIWEMKRFLNFWVLHSPNSIFHGCTYSFVLNFDWLIEVEFEPPGTDSRAEVILEQSF